MKSFTKWALLFPVVFGVSWGQEPNVAPEELPIPHANMVIVNVTTVPSIALKMDGQELYGDFRTGEKTSGGTFTKLTPKIEVVDNSSKAAYAETVSISPSSFQTLVVMGDFKDVEPGGNGIRGENTQKEASRNVAFLHLSHVLQGEEKAYRYRFVNAIPGKPIVCKTSGLPDVTIESGKAYSYGGKPLQIMFEVTQDSRVLPLKVKQENPVHNVTFVIYESEGKLRYVVIPEETSETQRERKDKE